MFGIKHTRQKLQILAMCKLLLIDNQPFVLTCPETSWISVIRG